MAERAARFRSVHVDFGTGDGAFVHHLARARPDTLVIGVDASADNLREASQRVGRKPSRGGLPNALFGRLSLAEAPGELCGAARSLSVLLPWGSLLRAVALPEIPLLGRLFDLCAPTGEVGVRFVFGYDAAADPDLAGDLSLPALDRATALSSLECSYREAGFAVTGRRLSLEQLGALPTTWARKLAITGRTRPFVELGGRVVSRPPPDALRSPGTGSGS